MTTWKTMEDAPKDRMLLWETRFGAMPAGQSEAAAVVGVWNPAIGNRAEVLYPSHWIELPGPPRADSGHRSTRSPHAGKNSGIPVC
jgi:hypothetical protein